MRGSQRTARTEGAGEGEGLWRRYQEIRGGTEELCRPLAIEDHCVQTMAEVSPPKWHLAHTTWFFETFLLIPFAPAYRVFHPQFDHLFNSYYETIGQPFPRPQRGNLSRPTVAEVHAYRHHVDTAMEHLMASLAQDPVVRDRLVLGLHHEQQHQELLLTDIKHIFGSNPLHPVYREPPAAAADHTSLAPIEWLEYPGGVRFVGHAGEAFAYDNERPRHRAYVGDFALASRPVSNGEFLEFVEAGGYADPEYWLADGWRLVCAQGWQAPLYWTKGELGWQYLTLAGLRPLDACAPVCHVSYYEAAAYARWAGRRLPTEVEWETAAVEQPVAGNFREEGHLHPRPAAPGERQFYGDVWEWTQSAYLPYPGYRAVSGALGEYNGKFMSGQLVLRGGSCATPLSHIRPSYRNFFYPHDRWQFSGLRLADDR